MRKTTLMFLAFILLFSVATARASFVRLDMDTLPEEEGWSLYSNGGDSSVSADGILTIDSPSYFLYRAPDWNDTVSNERGWVVETRLKVDSLTKATPEWEQWSNVGFWIHDHTYLTRIGFETDGVWISYADLDDQGNWYYKKVEYAMDTTSDFHVYRIEGKGQSFRLFVDENIAIEVVQVYPLVGTWSLDFGDIHGTYYSKSYWDYVWYNTSETLESIVDFHPDTLNLKSKGKYVTCYIELPEGYDIADIDLMTVTLNKINGASLEPSLPTLGPTEIGDYNGNGISDLMVKFDRQSVQAAVSAGVVELTVSCQTYEGTVFEGSDTVLVVDKGQQHNSEDHASVVY